MRREHIRAHGGQPQDVVAQLRRARGGAILGDHSIRSLIEDGRR